MPTKAPPPKSKPGYIGVNVKKARVAAGLTQNQVAHAMGFAGNDAGSYISRIEGTAYVPGLGNLELLAKVLKTTMAALLQKPRGK